MMSHTEEDKEPTQQIHNAPARRSSRSLFAVPTPIKQLFDIFPLLTYPVNDLPQRAPQDRNKHVLYIFTSEDGALKGLPSYNPACLKWQVRAPSDAIQPHT
jgi:metaxin